MFQEVYFSLLKGLDEAYRSANLSGNFSSSLPDRLAGDSNLPASVFMLLVSVCTLPQDLAYGPWPSRSRICERRPQV